MSLKIDELQAILIEAGVEDAKRSQVLKLAREAEEEAKADREAEKEGENKNKYRYVVLIRGDEETKKQVAGGAWLAQVVEDSDGTNLQKDLVASAARQNDLLSSRAKKSGGRGRKSKASAIQSWVELFNWLKPKVLNEVTNKGVKVKTKTPVEVQVLVDQDVPFSK